MKRHCAAVAITVSALIGLTACGPRRPALAISEFPPSLPPAFGDIPVNGGRTQAIAVDPRDAGNIVVATQFGGLWRRTGAKWIHVSSLPAVFARDVAFSPEGTTIYATLDRDNRTANGGGIWLSRDNAATWIRPTSAIPPAAVGVPERISAYGIAIDRYRRNRVYVGTDYGIAITEDAGNTWRHVHINPEPVAGTSVLDLPSNVVLATSSAGVHRSADGGSTWTLVRGGDFSAGFKALDNAERAAYPMGRPPRPTRGLNLTASKLVLVLQNVSTLFLYDDSDQSFVAIPTPAGGSRGPFVRVSRADDGASIFVWVGAGVNLLRTKVARTKAALSAIRQSDWTAFWRPAGLHDDSGHLGVDVNKRPVLYGSDGGIFRPINDDWSKWTNAATGKSGWNSLQITDLAGTNTEPLPRVYVNSLYFTTQDNAIWSSSDGGLTWPASDCAEGFHMEVRKDAASHDEVQAAYGKVGCGPSSFMLSDAHLANQRAAPDVDSAGAAVSGMGNTFLVSPGLYVRTRTTPGGWEIWVSSDNGASWRKRYNLAAGIAPAGVFQFTESSRRGYLPVIGAGVDAAGGRRIGLMPLFQPFRSGVITLGEASIRYLPNRGSLGTRATEFDWQAVFGLHRSNYAWLIAPDVNNGVVLVSRNAGATWTPDAELTAFATRNGSLLLYGGDAFRSQVTHISFSPYNTDLILIGTRDAGVMMTTDGGNAWWRVPGSDPLLYATGFAFRRDDMAIASSYGRGLWVLNLRYRPRAVSPLHECRACTIIDVRTGGAWSGNPKDVDSFIAHGGFITGARLRGRRLEAVTLSPGATWTRYVDLGKPIADIAIDTRDRSRGLRRLVPNLAAGQRVKGVLLAGTEVVAVIVGSEPFSAPPSEIAGAQEDAEQDRDSSQEPARPYVMVISDIEVSGRAIVGHDGVIRVFAGGFAPNTPVEILLDGRQVDQAEPSVDLEGRLTWRLDTAALSYGEHVVEIVQGEIRVQSRFVKAHVDRFDRPQKDAPLR